MYEFRFNCHPPENTGPSWMNPILPVPAQAEPAFGAHTGGVAPQLPPPKIKGYRELSYVEVDLINSVKETGMILARLLDDVAKAGGDPRWTAEARTDLQKGLMCLTRAVAKPTGF